ncbi:precorrin-6A reductase [Desulfosporosinus sp. PR]|uniref:precorrin-6A reductase n=1 Tax=Candidatus Desulfosporosinus nitrosoreducens TaxID=3401928 RepID=UPI0027FC7B1C|nr:precorrin-6A reductase [Desulfosporosinus sp. PR]MDQ7093452.1 precorrin-6A reductase [Desulfosporosinus sp. PR]
MKLFVMAGTEDGRQLAEALKKRGHDVLVSTLTAYGADLVSEQGLSVRSGAMNAELLTEFLNSNSYTALVDATHPYALRVKEIAQKVCAELSVPYFRWERSALELESHPLIHWVENIPAAAQAAASLGNRLLLTTGSNSLPEWTSQPCLRGKSLFIRVLPTSQVLARCETLGFSPKQIIAAQGPFSEEWDKAMFKQLKIEVVVAKESGKVGGTLEKVQACLTLNIPLILLKRPAVDFSNSQAGQTIAVSSIPEFIKQMEELL